MIQRHKFKNGLELIYQSSDRAIPITSVYVFCKVGSAYETDHIRGASHFVEHMTFKGTEKVKKVRNLLLKYNDIGSESNGFTTHKYTCYYIKADDQYFQKSYDILVDVLLHSTFPKKEFVKEQNVVVEENIRNEDDNINLITERIESIYYKGSSYENPVDSIKYHPTPTHLKCEDMYDWYKWFYVPSNMIISIVSQLPFSHIKNIVAHSDMAHSDMANDKQEKPPFALSIPKLDLLPIGPFSVNYFHKKSVKATTLSAGFRIGGQDSKDKYSLMLLRAILNGFGGRLFMEFRTKHGLTYRTKCIMDIQEHAGYFTIFLQTDPEKIIEVVSILIRFLKDLKKGITEDELRRGKVLVKGNLLRSMENIDTLAIYNGEESMYSDDFIPFQELYTRRFARITKKQVDDVILRYFKDMVVCILYDKIPKKKVDAMFRESINNF
jgi:hypothetical protein